jgi:hypothetical protein
MMMSEEEIQRLEAAAAQVRTQARRVELTALIGRLQEHVDRVGGSPGFERTLDNAKAELEALEQKEAPR